MKHRMGLYTSGFQGIKEGKQGIEIRLFDEKRSKIHLWDTIEFSLLPDLNESVEVEVIWLLRYGTFARLFQDISPELWNAPGWSIDECIRCLREIYTESDENKYGVLWIRIKLMNNFR